MTEEQKNIGWWAAIPGTLKALVGCITAISGLILTLHQTGITIEKFKELKCNAPWKWDAGINSCIKEVTLAKKNYTVKSNFYNKFIKKNKKNKKFFSSSKNEEYKFDLRNYANDILRNMNIKNIENIRIDTFSRKKSYFSYRRSLLNGDNDYGRCISIIFMK